MGVLGLMAYWINEVFDHLKTQETFIEAVEINPCFLVYVSDHLKTQEMCNKAVRRKPHFLLLVPGRLKIGEMCNKVVCKHPWLLKYVPDWFVTQQQLKIWLDDDEDKFFEWYKGYKKRKEQKAQIREELLAIASHPDRVMD